MSCFDFFETRCIFAFLQDKPTLANSINCNAIMCRLLLIANVVVMRPNSIRICVIYSRKPNISKCRQ